MAQVHLIVYPINKKEKCKIYYISSSHRLVFPHLIETFYIKNMHNKRRLVTISDFYKIAIVIDKFKTPAFNYDQFKEICCYGM